MVQRDLRLDRIKKNFYITLLILVVVLTITYFYTQPHKVVKVIEGNILVLDNGERVCLLGVDKSTPAQGFIRKMVEGKKVKLKYDRQKVNKYGQLIAYVYLLDDTFLNEEVIKQGYARSNKKITFKYRELFKHYEKEAKEKKKGMWSD